MDIKEQIHGLTEEMLTNLGRLVAIDSQLALPQRGNLLEKDLPKHWKKVLRLHRSLDLRQSIWTITVDMQKWVRAMRSLESPDIWISCQWVVTGLMIHLSLPVKATMYTDVELPMTKVRFWKRSTP